MSRSSRSPRPPLRPWQEKALVRFESGTEPDFLAVATPGAGKTIFALEAAQRALAAGRVRRVVVVTPTQHLKRQWARAADAFGLALEAEWTSRSALPADFHGVVVTYQQVASSKATLRRLSAHAFVVLDEVHHAAESRSWGDAIRLAFDASPRRLAISGTPFRSDENPIPFVRYVDSVAVADYDYGYAAALADGGVVRPVFFPRLGGRMEWTAPDGSQQAASFDDALDPALASQRLRTALSASGQWLDTVLAQANEQLVELRRTDPTAAGMVIAIDREHARAVAALLRARAGIVPTVALSDDPGASGRILRFARGDAPWIVAVRMVSEGVDIPRLRVGVYATSTRTDLFFRQAVGRLVRFTPGDERQSAYFYLPDDPRLRSFAVSIQEERRHALAPRRDDGAGEGPPRPPREERPVRENLFAPISAVPEGEFRLVAPVAPTETKRGPAPASSEDSRLGVHVDAPASPSSAALSLRERREALRQRNATLVRELVHRKRRSHAEVNAELNRRVGLSKVTEATLAQLERRVAAAEAWLRRR